MIAWLGNGIMILVLTFILHRKVFRELPPIIFWSAFLLKLSAGIVLGLILNYEYQTSDSFTYFQLGKDILSGSNLDISQPRVQFFSTCLVPFIWITKGSYWLTGLWISCLSFYVYAYFVVRFTQLFPGKRTVTVIAFLFIPTVIFWSSGVLKGTLTNPATVFLVLMILVVYKNEKINLYELVIAILSFLLLLKIKHYLFISLLLFTGLIVSLVVIRRLQKSVKWLVVLLILGSTSFFSQKIHPYLTADRLAQTIYETNQTILKLTSPEKRVNIEVKSPDLTSVFNELPTAVFTGLFRPSIQDKTPLWGIFHQLENLILTSLTIFSLLLLIRNKPQIDWILICSSLLVILFLASLLAMTTPNFGSLIRYRNAFMPFLFLIVSILPLDYLLSKPSDNH